MIIDREDIFTKISQQVRQCKCRSYLLVLMDLTLIMAVKQCYIMITLYLCKAFISNGWWKNTLTRENIAP